MFESIVEQRGQVAFPKFSGERVYMLPFLKDRSLPDHLARWQDTVDGMMAGIDTDEECYLMIDQSPVLAGNSHRRGGWHVDGYWNPGVKGHGHSGTLLRGYNGHRAIGCNGGHGSVSIPSGHRSEPLRHTPEPAPYRHRPAPARHTAGSSSWANPDFSVPELIVLASDLTACRAAVGQYSGVILDGGDCSQIDVSGMDIVTLEAGLAYAGNVSFLHESLPINRDCNRTVVRINVPHGVLN